MRCPRCGTKAEHGSTVCKKCGANVGFTRKRATGEIAFVKEVKLTLGCILLSCAHVLQALAFCISGVAVKSDGQPKSLLLMMGNRGGIIAFCGICAQIVLELLAAYLSFRPVKKAVYPLNRFGSYMPAAVSAVSFLWVIGGALFGLLSYGTLKSSLLWQSLLSFGALMLHMLTVRAVVHGAEFTPFPVAHSAEETALLE